MHVCCGVSVVASSYASVSSVRRLLIYTVVSRLKTDGSRVVLRVLQCYIISFEIPLGQHSTVSFRWEMVPSVRSSVYVTVLLHSSHYTTSFCVTLLSALLSEPPSAHKGISHKSVGSARDHRIWPKFLVMIPCIVFCPSLFIKQTSQPEVPWRAVCSL